MLRSDIINQSVWGNKKHIWHWNILISLCDTHPCSIASSFFFSSDLICRTSVSAAWRTEHSQHGQQVASQSATGVQFSRGLWGRKRTVCGLFFVSMPEALCDTYMNKSTPGKRARAETVGCHRFRGSKLHRTIFYPYTNHPRPFPFPTWHTFRNLSWHSVASLE